MEGLLQLYPLISGEGKLWEDCQEFLQTPHHLQGRGRLLRVQGPPPSGRPSRGLPPGRWNTEAVSCTSVGCEIETGKPPGGISGAGYLKRKRSARERAADMCLQGCAAFLGDYFKCVHLFCITVYLCSPSDVLSRGWYFMAMAVPASSTTVLLEINFSEL